MPYKNKTSRKNYQKTEHIDLWRFAELLKQYTLQYEDEKIATGSAMPRITIPSNKVLQHIIKTYFTACINKAIKEGTVVSLGDAGQIQVLEMLSKKDFKWDEKYGGKDWKLLFHNDQKEVVSKFDEKLTEQVLKRALQGMEYPTDLMCHEKRIGELLLLLGRTEKQQYDYEKKERYNKRWGLGKKKERESSIQDEGQNSSTDAK